jgi:hypothetical protein
MRRAFFVSIVFASLAAGSCAYAEEIATSNKELLRDIAALETRNAKLEKEIAALRRVRELEATHAKLEGEKAALRGRTRGYEDSKQFVSTEPNATATTAAYASVANLPTKAPTAIGAENGYYFWLDGMYDRVRLPTYQLGYHNIGAGAGGSDLGTVQTFDPRLNGGGVRGAIGYVLPGTSTKFEFGGSYVEAKQSQSQSTTSSNSDVVAQFINGSLQNGVFLCFFSGPACTTAGELKTDYSAWHLNGKVSNDWKFGSVTVTPSLAVFGGSARVDQTLSQSFLPPLSGIQGIYSASTTENWRDIGARLGVDVSAPVTTALTARVGGWVGGANRITFLSGNDIGTNIISGILNSTLSIADSKNVLLANAEVGFAYQLAQMVAFRGFAGLNYDGSVPGIASPAYTGTFSGTPTSTTAARIYYASEISYYAGGGVAVKW